MKAVACGAGVGGTVAAEEVDGPGTFDASWRLIVWYSQWEQAIETRFTHRLTEDDWEVETREVNVQK